MVPVEMTEDAAHMRHVCLRRGSLMLAQDARLGGKAPVKGFDGKTPMTLVECASAGSTWYADSNFTVWIEDGEGTNHE